jgi:hypothetical protein
MPTYRHPLIGPYLDAEAQRQFAQQGVEVHGGDGDSAFVTVEAESPEAARDKLGWILGDRYSVSTDRIRLF